MPRSNRIDAPGLLQHVIVRGIERSVIFFDDQDRQRFLQRFSSLLEETGTECFAWALMTNHFHLLLRTSTVPLSIVMRRLLTGYAVYFNGRHSRAGHLFQNRYKSIVCEEEPYLLELIRYIHLNPLRAGAVRDLSALDRYPWAGHAVLIGISPMAGQNVREVLGRFDEDIPRARQLYREFVGDGIPLGTREDLIGGGLRRSQGRRAREDRESFDERILGGGVFVDRLREQRFAGSDITPWSRLSLAGLIEIVCDTLGVDKGGIQLPSKVRKLALARGIICFLAIREMGLRAAEVGRELNLGPAGVSIALRRGEGEVRGNAALMEELQRRARGE